VTAPAVRFDRVARPYRWLEYGSFGPALARCRRTHLAQLAAARHALVLGDGDGRFLAALMAVNRSLTADVVDSSECLLQILERRVGQLGPEASQRISSHHADALAWRPTRPYDLIVSHFFLDCFFPQQIDSLLDRIVPYALPGARWVISEFGIPRNPVAALLARGMIRLLYQAFGVLTGLPVRALPDYASMLRARGFKLTMERPYLAGLLCSQVWCLSDHAALPL
jgi:hypothetical protein